MANESGRSHCEFKAILLARFAKPHGSPWGPESFEIEAVRASKRGKLVTASVEQEEKKDHDELPELPA